MGDIERAYIQATDPGTSIVYDDLKKPEFSAVF